MKKCFLFFTSDDFLGGIMRLKSRIETSQETSYNGRLTIYLLTDELKIKGWRRFNTFSHEEILMLSNKTQIFQQLPHKVKEKCWFSFTGIIHTNFIPNLKTEINKN